MLKAEQAKQGLQEDPITEFTMMELLPRFEKALLEDSIKGTRKDWIIDHLFPAINEKFGIDGPNGYNVSKFQEVSYAFLH